MNERPESIEALAFVYNADSGLFNTLTDIAHKLLSPDTYECNLCAITHSPLGMRAEWKEFLEALGLPMEFYHRDELRDLALDPMLALPTILARTADGTQVLVNAESVNAAKTLDDLQALITNRLKDRAREE